MEELQTLTPTIPYVERLGMEQGWFVSGPGREEVGSKDPTGPELIVHLPYMITPMEPRDG